MMTLTGWLSQIALPYRTTVACVTKGWASNKHDDDTGKISWAASCCLQHHIISCSTDRRGSH